MLEVEIDSGHLTVPRAEMQVRETTREMSSNNTDNRCDSDEDLHLFWKRDIGGCSP